MEYGPTVHSINENLAFCSYLEPNLLMTIDLTNLFPGVKDLDEKSVYALLKAMKSNFETNNFDYLNFKQTVKALSKMDMDEVTAYKSAYISASTMGLTKEKLKQSAESYANILDRERESFATALLSQKSQKIEGRKSEVSELQNKIEAHKNKIKELEREMEIFTERINSVDQDVEMAETKIEGTKQKFLTVYKVLSEEISKDITTINNYL